MGGVWGKGWGVRGEGWGVIEWVKGGSIYD